MKISELRSEYHKQICKEIVWLKSDKGSQYPNFADSSSQTSRKVALGVHKRINCNNHRTSTISEQEVGRIFEKNHKVIHTELLNFDQPFETS